MPRRRVAATPRPRGRRVAAPPRPRVGDESRRRGRDATSPWTRRRSVGPSVPKKARVRTQARGVRAHVAFANQRGATPLAPAAVEPKLGGCFYFEIARPSPKTPAAWRNALEKCASSIRIVVTRERVGGGAHSSKRELVATASLDWREALLDRGSSRSIPLKAAGPDAGAGGDVATLDVALDVARLGSATPPEPPFDAGAVEDAMRKTRADHAEAARGFYLYAKTWWDSFAKGPGRDLGARAVKLFARDEAGEMRCVCSYVHPLRANRVLDGPRQRAPVRFSHAAAPSRCTAVGGGSRRRRGARRGYSAGDSTGRGGSRRRRGARRGYSEGDRRSTDEDRKDELAGWCEAERNSVARASS